RLERADCEHVLALLRRTVLRELVLDRVRNDMDLLLRDAEQLDQLATRELGDRDHLPGRPKHVRNDARAVLTRPPVEGPRMAQHRQVMHSHDERHARRPHRAAIGRAMEYVRRLYTAEQERA